MNTKQVEADNEKHASDVNDELLQYKYFFNNTTDFATIATVDGCFEIINPQFENLLGYSKKELLENKISSFVHPDDIAATTNEIEKLKDGAASVNFLNRYRQKSGNYLWLEWTMTPNHVKGKVYGIARNITERKKSESLLLENEKALEEAQHLAHIGSWSWDIKKNEIKWSKELYAITGLNPELPLPNFTNLSSVYTKASWKLLAQAVEKTVKDGTPYELELEMIRPDGHIRRTFTKGRAVKDETGHIVLLYGTCQDITERKLAEEILQERETRFRILYESSFDAIMTLEPPSWKFSSGNSSALKMFLAKDEKEFTSKEPWQLSPERQPDGQYSADKAKHQIDQAMQEGSSFFEWVHKRLNGEDFPATVLLTRVEISGKKFLQATVRDITDSKKAETDLIKKSHDLENANKELEQFAYLASHDLQEPLLTISNFVGLLENKYSGKLDIDADRYLNFINAASTKIRNLIKDLLDYSRIGKDATFTTVDCNEVLKEVLSEMQKTIKENNAKIKFSILPVLTGDKIRLKQLFRNLISNAIKFRKKNVFPEIEITIEQKDNEYLFAIKDNGIGIEEQYFIKLFNIFQRLNNATEYHGTGIGLASSKKIVEQHNGKIWVESKIDEGSTFYFTISKKLEKLNP